LKFQVRPVSVLTPVDPPIELPAGHERSPQSSPDKGKWSLSQQALYKLLARFSDDREVAGRQYELMRQKLTRFFERKFSQFPEGRADETINRVAKKIDEGQVIDNLNGYFFGVARLVFKEEIKQRERERTALESQPIEVTTERSFDEHRERRLQCFDNCLEKLSSEHRTLIIEYYDGEGTSKTGRRLLAEKLQIPLNALRIRTHRIRMRLEKCVSECLILVAET
jgi:DNA-directed RNA polymerase specialized sigma24 family protein